MANDAKNVSTGKAKVGGAIYRATTQSALPADAKTALDAAYKCLGYVSEDGVVNSNSPESNDIKAWGGDTVLSSQTGKKDTFKFTLIESMNEEVQKAIYGSDNVTTESGLMTVLATSEEQEYAAWAIDMILKGGKVKRISIPYAKITEIGDVVYKDDEAIGYEVTITAAPYTEDDVTYTHKDFIE